MTLSSAFFKLKSNLIRYTSCMAILIALDQITKYYAQFLVQPYKINSYTYLVLQYNRGISWGMLDSENSFVFTMLSCCIAVCVLFFLLYMIVKYLNNNKVWPEVVVLAGAMSNLIDRCLYKGVVDFILFTCPYGSWPVFNLADIYIVVGLLWMMYKGFYE